jgi:DNA repair protein RecN (Recombination protein N)
VQTTLQLLADADIQVQEATHNLQDFLASFNQDPERLNVIEQRLQTIHDLARKHRVDAKQLSTLHQQLQIELDELQSAETHIADLQHSLQEQAAVYQTHALNLSKKRKTAAKKLSQQVTQNLHALGIANGEFHLQFTSNADISSTGLEHVDFMLNTNPGQTPGPLNKIASGGELSRVSLALQVIIARHYQTPVIIFDEVDVGIGGATAEIVGQLLRTLGQQGQVLCITHLAQVAAQAQQHLRVEKATDGKTTQSQIIYLNTEQRVHEIARMLGGQRISKQTLAHAQEMLETNE